MVDARRPKIGVDLEPVAPDVQSPGQSGWALPGAVLGMGALLVLANELSDWGPRPRPDACDLSSNGCSARSRCWP